MMRARCMMQWSLIAALLIAGAAYAQQLYRWTDEKGRVHITDTPPPASARDVQKKNPAGNVVDSSPPPYEVALAMKDFPVSLYTSPTCKEACAMAREALNKRAVPFKEIQVWNGETNEELKRVTGGNEVPTLVVGRSVHKGFEQDAYDALLDSARYPKAGALPPRAQAAPKEPAGYVTPAEREAAKPGSTEPPVEEQKPGPYSPGSTPPPRRTPQKK